LVDAHLAAALAVPVPAAGLDVGDRGVRQIRGAQPGALCCELFPVEAEPGAVSAHLLGDGVACRSVTVHIDTIAMHIAQCHLLSVRYEPSNCSIRAGWSAYRHA